MDDDGDPPAFIMRAVTLTPGSERAYDTREWGDAIVAVARGEIELEWPSGASRRFGQGALLCLKGLSLRALRNCGRDLAVLVAVSRR
jgi:hypothetical protein